MAKATPKVSTSPRVCVRTPVTSLAIGPATSLGHASSSRRAASSANSLEPKKTPASAVTTMRKGNIAINVERAIWLAMAQPSSAIKPRNASIAIQNVDLINRNAWLRKGARPSHHLSTGRLQERRQRGIRRPARPPAIRLGSLHVGEELPHFGFQAFGFDRNRIGKRLDVASRSARIAGDVHYAAHRFGAGARFVGGAPDAFGNRDDRRILLADRCRHRRGDGR